MDDSERLHAVGIVATLFDHLSTCRDQRRAVLRIDHAAGNLERTVANAVTVLAHQHHVLRRGDRNDVDPVGRLENVKVVLGAVA